MNKEKLIIEAQSTVKTNDSAGESLTYPLKWSQLDWNRCNRTVNRLQLRIAKAVKEKRWNKVKVLQNKLTHCFSAKLLAVKKVTSNKGARTSGIDGVIWNTNTKKMNGVKSLRTKGYKALPMRRIYIKKRNGAKRPLSIPSMKDRAIQALYKLALEPISETLADPNSYGFRPYRSCRDAISQAHKCLSKSYSSEWILEADIKACFDDISHQWLLDNIPINKKILTQWLKCGFIDKKKRFPTKAGTGQGSVISPTLMNMTLDGLEDAILAVSHKKHSKVHVIRYADDLIVTSVSKEHLQKTIIPVMESFLRDRGLTLSKEKTQIVHIKEGFDFLGQNIRKFKNKLIIQPAKKDAKSFYERLKKIVKSNISYKTEVLIKSLTPIIRGWCNYHRYVQSATVFSRIEYFLVGALMNWGKRRHPNKGIRWFFRKYFRTIDNRRSFGCWARDKKNQLFWLKLVLPSDVRLVRYCKVKALANPFDTFYSDYFNNRKTSNICWSIVSVNRLPAAA